MQQESRVKKTLLNARVNLIFYFLTLALSFFSRKIFLNTLGADFVGLTGTLQNLLGFLNLAELGVGSAIGYLLYKPLYDHDQTKINEIISVMGYLYRWIGLVILAGGIILSFFLPLIFPSDATGFSLPLIYFAYYSFLGSSLIGYFINYRQNLLGADQRNYVVTAYFQSANIIKTGIQMALAWYTGSYYLWVIVEFTFGIIYSIILNWKINQTYPWLRANIRSGRALFKQYPEVMTKTKQLFVHKTSSFFQYQTTPFLIYAFVNITTVAYYINYMIVIDKISALLNTFFESVTASLGNLIAEGNKKRILAIYWTIFNLKHFVATIIISSIFILINPFINLWLGGIYLLSTTTIILILCILYVGIIRTDQFLYAFGLFNDVWASVAMMTVSLILSLTLGGKCGLNGILIGNLIGLFVIICIWKPYYLFKTGLKENLSKYWFNFIINFIVMIFVIITGSGFVENICPIDTVTNWIRFLYYATITLVYISTLSLLIYGLRSKLFIKEIFRLVKSAF